MAALNLISLLFQGQKTLSTLLSSSNMIFQLILKLGQLVVKQIPDLHGDASHKSCLFLQKNNFAAVLCRQSPASFNTTLHQIRQILLLLVQSVIEHFKILRFLRFPLFHLSFHRFDVVNQTLNRGIFYF